MNRNKLDRGQKFLEILRRLLEIRNNLRKILCSEFLAILFMRETKSNKIRLKNSKICNRTVLFSPKLVLQPLFFRILKRGNSNM